MGFNIKKVRFYLELFKILGFPLLFMIIELSVTGFQVSDIEREYDPLSSRVHTYELLECEVCGI